LAYHAKYRLNPNYTVTMKQNIDKLLAIGFIQLVEEATWLPLIMVIPNKNGKLVIYGDLCNNQEGFFSITIYR